MRQPTNYRHHFGRLKSETWRCLNTVYIYIYTSQTFTKLVWAALSLNIAYVYGYTDKMGKESIRRLSTTFPKNINMYALISKLKQYSSKEVIKNF